MSEINVHPAEAIVDVVLWRLPRMGQVAPGVAMPMETAAGVAAAVSLAISASALHP